MASFKTRGAPPQDFCPHERGLCWGGTTDEASSSSSSSSSSWFSSEDSRLPSAYGLDLGNVGSGSTLGGLGVFGPHLNQQSRSREFHHTVRV